VLTWQRSVIGPGEQVDPLALAAAGFAQRLAVEGHGSPFRPLRRNLLGPWW
jgi:hypothetical protein